MILQNVSYHSSSDTEEHSRGLDSSLLHMSQPTFKTHSNEVLWHVAQTYIACKKKEQTIRKAQEQNLKLENFSRKNYFSLMIIAGTSEMLI